MLKQYYYTIENNDGRVYIGTITRREAVKLCRGFSNEGVCYKRRVGDPNYAKICFMW